MASRPAREERQCVENGRYTCWQFQEQCIRANSRRPRQPPTPYQDVNTDRNRDELPDIVYHARIMTRQ